MPSTHEEICDPVVCRCECTLCQFGEDPDLVGLHIHVHVCSTCGERLTMSRTNREYCEDCEDGIDR